MRFYCQTFFERWIPLTSEAIFWSSFLCRFTAHSFWPRPSGWLRIFTSWSCPWPPTACTVWSCPSGQSESFENYLKWLPMPKNMALDTRTMFLACSEAELEFHSLKCSLSPYSPSTLFMAFKSIWGLWKLSQMIAYAQKHSFEHQNHVSSMLRSWVRRRKLAEKTIQRCDCLQ